MGRALAKVLVLKNRFLLGGQERQTVLHLATMDPLRWTPIVRCLSLDGEVLEDLRRIGIRPVGLGIRHLVSLRTAWRIARLAAFLRAEQVALVHANDFYSNVLGTLLALGAGVPCLVTRVDLGHELTRAQRLTLAWVSRLASRVVVNALAIRELCLRDGVAAHRIAVVRNGIDLGSFDAAAVAAPADRAVDPACPILIQVANMHQPVKGQGDLIMAMLQVVQEVNNARLVLVGDGHYRARWERLARELGVAGAVQFAGARRDVPAMLVRSAVAVSASHAEGLSNAVLEAMAARRPVVATAVGGTPELVRDGETGFLVPPGAPAPLARKIIELLRDPALAQRMGQEGRRTVERGFDLEGMRRSYHALYESVLAETSEPRSG